MVQKATHTSKTRAKAKLNRLDVGALRCLSHEGANKIVGQQTGGQFLAKESRGLHVERLHVHGGFDMAKIDLDLPAMSVQSNNVSQRITFLIKQVGEQIEHDWTKTWFTQTNENKAANNGRGW